MGVCKYGHALTKLRRLTPSQRAAVLRSNITLSKRSLVPSSSRFGFALLAVGVVAGCSVYSPDLTEGGALSNGGTTGQSGNGGTAANTSGGTSAAAGDGANDAAGDGGSGAAARGGSTNGGTGAAGSGAATAGTSSTGGSGTAGGTGTAGSATVGGTGGASNLDLIDDLEDGDDLIRRVNSPKRDGIWDSGNDGTSGGMQTPTPGNFKGTLLGADAPYAGDMYAAYSKATGYAQYAFMNVSMRSWPTYDTTYPKYDASAYKGIQFLAKVGSGSSRGVHVRFISGDTDPRGGKCKLPTDTPTPAQSELCYNHYYAAVTLTNSWATYTLSFADDFVQGGDGMVDPTIDLKEMYGLEFYFGAGDDYEIWVDDLAFVKE